MMRILLIELRRSPLYWWLPLLLLVDVAVLFGRSTDWIGIWPQASAAAQLPVFYVAMPLAAGAAFAAGRMGQNDAVDTLAAAALPGWRRELAQLASTVLLGLIPLVIGAAIAAVVSANDAGPGFLWPSYLVLGSILIAVSAAVGHLLGRAITNRIAAPLVAVAVMFILVGYQPLPWLQFTVLSGAPQYQVEPLAVLARAAFAAAVVLVALTVGGRPAFRQPGRGRLRTALPVVASVVAVLAGIVSVALVGPLRTERPAPDHPLCSDTVPRVCVWPEHRVHLAAAATAAGRIGRLSGTVNVPDTFYEEGLRAPVGTNSDFPLVFGDWAAARGMVSRVLDETLGVPTCAPPTGERLERNTVAWIELKEWMVSRAYGPKPDDVQGGFEYDEAEIARVVALDEAEQAAWARGRLTVIRETSCG